MSLTTEQVNQAMFANLILNFCNTNNLYIFSKDELIDVSKQICNILGLQKHYSFAKSLSILSKHRVAVVVQKRLKSCRSRLWFCKPLNPITLKVAVRA